MNWDGEGLVLLTAVTITEVSPSLQKRKDQELFLKAETFVHMLLSVSMSVITSDEFVPVR